MQRWQLLTLGGEGSPESAGQHLKVHMHRCNKPTGFGSAAAGPHESGLRLHVTAQTELILVSES